MDTMDEQDETSTDNGIDAQRSIIRQSLDEIADEVGAALRDVGLRFPVYITVRNSGDSLATIATPLDPSDGDWSRAAAVVCRIVGQKIGSDSLRGRELPCNNWYEQPIVELQHRDLVRDQALGGAYAADDLEVPARYEAHLDRKLERTLTMLLRLRELRQPATPA